MSNKNDFFIKFENEFAQRSFNQKETLQWLNRNKVITMSWGYHQPTALKDTGLMFKVNGYHHKGWVLITLEHDDTYTVRFLSIQFNEKLPRLEMVYCDELQEQIDNVIERIPNYSN